MHGVGLREVVDLMPTRCAGGDQHIARAECAGGGQQHTLADGL
jgi:hypothetical protein